MKLPKWEARIERAAHLAQKYPFAREVLDFFQAVSKVQAQIYSEMKGPRRETAQERSTNLQKDSFPPDEILQHFPKFLASLGAVSPDPLAEAAANLGRQTSDRWRGLFASCWQSTAVTTHADMDSEIALGRMFLQPLAEFFADHRTPTSNGHVPSACPYCFEKPTVGVLRPEGDGGKRSLICSMCATEWNFGRILCPACGEQNVEKLAVYTTDPFQHVRIEACDTCHYYIKTVDLTKTGRAVPVVDELATIPLNLWASEHGYKKLQTNLLGL